MKETVKKYANELTNGIKTMFKEFFNKDTNKKQRANMWTFSRLIITLPILIFTILSTINFSTPLLISNSILVAFGALTDFFDGKSARKYNSSSEFGKLLDQVIDKIFSIVVGITLTIINPLYLLLLLGEGIIATINVPFSLKYKELKDTSNQIGRIKQWPLGLSFLLGYLSPLSAGLNIATTITVITTFLLQIVTALSYTKRNIDGVKEIKEREKKKLLNIEEDFDKNKELQKSIGEKTISSNTTNNVNDTKLSNKELYTKLKELKNELTNNENNVEIKEDNYQKTKKL